MAIRTHIAKQDEAQTERAVQLLSADPGSPVENQLWINLTDGVVKTYSGGETKIIGAIGSELAAHIAATTSVHGIADTAALATKTGTEQLTNKDIDGGTASDSHRMTLPKASTSTLSGLTRKQGTMMYDTTKGSIVFDDGTNVKDVGGGALVVTGQATSPQSIAAPDGIEFTGSAPRNLWFIAASVTGITITANPQIAAGSNVGQELVIVAGSGFPVTINDGNGVVQNGPWTGYVHRVIAYFWDGTNWVELFRSY